METLNDNPIDYIGDGVYILFDGHGFELRANSHIDPTDVIYLEPEVLNSLINWTKRFTNQQGETDEKDQHSH